MNDDFLDKTRRIFIEALDGVLKEKNSRKHFLKIK